MRVRPEGRAALLTSPREGPRTSHSAQPQPELWQRASSAIHQTPGTSWHRFLSSQGPRLCTLATCTPHSQSDLLAN
jgi:hypothetical protein